MEMFGFNERIAFCEAKGLREVFAAYAENCPCEYIEMVGFNPNSGYVYIALDNGIQIGSYLGQRVEFIVMDFETGEESFFDSYFLANNFLAEV